MKRVMEKLQGDSLDIQKQIADLCSSGAGIESESVCTGLALNDIIAPYVREQMEQLLSERISSFESIGESQVSRLVEAHETLLEDMKHILFNKEGESKDVSCQVAEISNAEPKAVKLPDIPRHKATENVTRLLGALVMCLKQLDENERDLRESDLTLKRYEKSVESMTNKVSLLYERNHRVIEAAKDSEDQLRNRVEHLLMEREGHLTQIDWLENLAQAQEKTNIPKSDPIRMEETIEKYKTRCDELTQELEYHRNCVDEVVKQEQRKLIGKKNERNTIQTSAQSTITHLRQLLSEKDHFIEKLQEKLKKSRDGLRSEQRGMTESMINRIQSEHSEAIGILKQIASGFSAGSNEMDHIGNLKRKLHQLGQEKAFISSKYYDAIDEMDKMI